MGLDKIFVLVLTICFFAFVAFLAWHSRKNQAAGKTRSASADTQPAADEEAEPSAAPTSPTASSKRSSKRR